MSDMSCRSIIKDYLITNGYDGLLSPDELCRCELSDLVPCGYDFSECVVGYKVVPPEGVKADFDFYICNTKGCKPWEHEW